MAERKRRWRGSMDVIEKRGVVEGWKNVRRGKDREKDSRCICWKVIWNMSKWYTLVRKHVHVKVKGGHRKGTLVWRMGCRESSMVGGATWSERDIFNPDWLDKEQHIVRDRRFAPWIPMWHEEKATWTNEQCWPSPVWVEMQWNLKQSHGFILCRSLWFYTK